MKTIGVVLAGGLSSRMLSDKSQLVWQGKTLLQHTVGLMIDAGCEEVLISNNNNPDYISDRYTNAGPLGGIDACLNHINQFYSHIDAMMIMPVDMPLMSVELLRNLKDSAHSGMATYYSLDRFPLVLPADEQLKVLLERSLETNKAGRGASIRHLLKSLVCQVLELNDDQKRLFFNCNTPEQWQNITID